MIKWIINLKERTYKKAVELILKGRILNKLREEGVPMSRVGKINVHINPEPSDEPSSFEAWYVDANGETIYKEKKYFPIRD